MKLTKALLVVAAGLILATQAQAEVVDFAGLGNGDINDFGAWESGDYVLTLSEAPVTGVEVTFGGDSVDMGWYLYGEHLQMEDGDEGYSIIWFDTSVQVPSIVIGNENGSGAANTGTCEGMLGSSVEWTATLTDNDTWTTFTEGDGLTIDSLRFRQTAGSCFDIDDIDVLPEPATLALLGLGGLGLLIRRRR